MHPVKSLERLLGGRSKRTTGRVVSTNAREVVLATASGSVTVPRSDATAYRAGDTVTIRDGKLVGRTRRDVELPVFVV